MLTISMNEIFVIISQLVIFTLYFLHYILYIIFFILGVPQLNIRRIAEWPTRVHEPLGVPEPIVDVEMVNIADPEEERPAEEPEYVMVNVSQLKFLLRQCYFCGRSISEDNHQYRFEAGTVLT